MLQTKFEKFFDKIDLTLLKRYALFLIPFIFLIYIAGDTNFSLIYLKAVNLGAGSQYF
jgi:hypothetical protein